ncbi:lebercilin-like protein isoform X3 [Patiria miniata]|uniref:Lebercilin domain-containing protein n=1 Tax=Patiria miniata TaxID=46514 RepID=A0A914BM95_PATMI|nr:lebercilin-like protein isoform X3 [Patiria miniata]
MTAVNDNDSFFDSDGEHDNQKADSPYLKGAYDRRGDSPATQRVAKNKSLTPSTSGNFSAKSSDSIMSEKRGTKSYRYDDSPSRSRSRSQTPSPYRSPLPRSPAYSDSFNSEDSDQDSRKASPERTKKETSAKPRGRARGGYSSTSSNRFNSGTSQDSRTTFKGYGGSSNYGKTNNRTKKAFQKTPIKKPAAANNTNKRSNSIASSQASPRNAGNEVTRRMLSAKGHTISRLRNEFNQLQQQHDETLQENKLLKALQRRQERALAKFDNEESELPQLLKKHSAELDSMRRRIRKYQEHERDKDRRMKDKDERLLRTEDELKSLSAVAEDKGLLERHELQKRVDRLKTKLENRDKKIEEQERYVEHMKKNQRHELRERQGREEELKGRMGSLERENERLQMQLREKEKELEVRNIYSNRLIKPPGKLRYNLSPTSLKPVMLSKATSTVDQPKLPHPPPPDRQPRDRSAEELRRREETNARVKSPKDVTPKKEDKIESEKPKWEEPKQEEPKSKEPKQELSEHEKILRDLDMGWEKRDGGEGTQRQEEERRRQEEADKRKKQEEERQWQLAERLRREEEEERWRRHEKEEAEAKKKREEEEKQERERKKKEVLQDTSYSPHFDNSPGDDAEENIPFFGSKPTEAQKPPTTKTPPYAVNSVRDLQKYSRGDISGSPKRGRDEGGTFGQNQANNADQEKEAERLAEERRKKDLLLARMRDIDDGKKPDSGKSHKNYNFSKPVENLHNGIPSHPDEAAPTKAKKDDALAFGSYAPTFTSSKAAQKPKKKSFFDDEDDEGDPFSKPTPAASQPDKRAHLMATVFCDSPSEEKSTKSSFGDDKNVFTSSTKAKPVSYPWEKKVEIGGGANATNPAVANGVKDKGPPASKAAMNMSHDSLDDIDDIEEVIL